jgi:hypothetical protein
MILLIGAEIALWCAPVVTRQKPVNASAGEVLSVVMSH